MIIDAYASLTQADFDEAARFIERLIGAPAAAARLYFQTFDDSEQKREELACVIHGTLREAWPRLQAFQQKGAGVFVTVNASEGGRKKDDVTRIRAVWRDVDKSTAADLPIEEHIRVRTSGGFHSYLLTDAGPAQFDEWAGVMRTMVAGYGADKNAKDLV